MNNKGVWAASLAASICTTLFGPFDIALRTLVVFIVLDYVTGVIKGWLLKEISSARGYQGLIKKSLILVVIIIANMADDMLGTNGLFRNAICYIYISIESISILENLAACGVPIPKVLVDKLVQLRDSAEKSLK